MNHSRHTPGAAAAGGAGLSVRVIVLLIAGMATFAFAPILVRVAGQADPFALAAIRTVSAAVVLLPFLLVKRAQWRLAFTWRDNVVAAIAGGVLGLHFIFWILALQHTSVASASVLVTIHPVLLILVESLLFRRVFPRLAWFGVFLAFAGSVLLGYSDMRAPQIFEHALLGDMYAVIAAMLFALYFLLSQRLRQKSDWLGYVVRVYGATALACLVAAVLAGSAIPDRPEIWLAGIALALGPQLIGHGSMNYAVKYVSPTLLSTLVLTEPVFATLLAMLLFAEFPPGGVYVAMMVVLSGIVMAWLGRRRTGV